jgi:hypothetical protein
VTTPLLIDRVPVLAEVDISIATLRERLRASGAVLETPARLAATGRDDWSANRC